MVIVYALLMIFFLRDSRILKANKVKSLHILMQTAVSVNNEICRSPISLFALRSSRALCLCHIELQCAEKGFRNCILMKFHSSL